MKFIHIADVHLGMKPDRDFQWSETREREIKDTFNKVIEVCNAEHIDFLLIAGDLFHKKPLLRELKEVNYVFSKLERTKVILIAGNHDYIGESSRYKEFPWCNHVTMIEAESIEKVSFSEKNVHIYGCSYHQRDQLKKVYENRLPDENEGVHILLIHGGDEKSMPIDKKHLMELGYDYVALGHIHKHEFLTESMAYPGSLEPLDKNETGKHGYILGIIEEDKKVQASFIPFAKREYVHQVVDVNPGMTNGELYDKVIEIINLRGEENIYKIIIEGKHDVDLVIDDKGIYSLGHIIQVENESVPDYDFEALAAENKGNIIGMYIEELYKKEIDHEVLEKALYYGIEALISVKE